MHAAINSKLFKKLDHGKNYFSQVELAKEQIQHDEPTIVGFSVLEYAKLRLWEL